MSKSTYWVIQDKTNEKFLKSATWRGPFTPSLRLAWFFDTRAEAQNVLAGQITQLYRPHCGTHAHENADKIKKNVSVRKVSMDVSSPWQGKRPSFGIS